MNHLKIHLRVVAALVVREMNTRFGGKPGGYLWAFLEPIAYITMMTVIFMSVSRVPPLGPSYPLFFATGTIAYRIYSTTENFVSAAIKSNKSLLRYPVVAPVDAIVARFTLQLLTLSFVAITVIWTLIEFSHQAFYINWKYILESGFYASILSLGVGMINIVLFESSPLYEKIYGIATRPLFIISGVMFIPDSLPAPYRDVVLANPICQIIVLFRKGIYSEYRAEYLDVTYLAKCAFPAFFIGFLLFSLSSKKLRANR